jgi:hypothetical protein
MSFTPQQQRVAYDRLPLAVREYLASERFGDLMLELSKRYVLHADVAAKLSEGVSNMLLGLVNPAQFQEELIATGIPANLVPQITQDLNERVFKPLQQKLKEPSQEEPEVSSTETVSSPPSASTLLAQPQSMSVRSVPPAPEAPLVPPLAISLPPISPPSPVPILKPGPTAPLPSAPVPMPKAVPIPPNLPGISLPETEKVENQPTPNPPPAPVPPPVPKATPSSQPPQPMKTYGVDPYREPVE